MKTTGKAQLLRSTLLAALAVAPGAVTGAYAQQAPGGPAAEDKADVVVVTGSRIARQDYVANSPIVTVGAEDIQATGVTTLDTLLNEMPQFVPAINQTSNNPSNGGQANISLRGLGTNRTLILMNGRRVVPSNSDGTVDVNLIPSQLVKSIEVVTGGASSTYGSDAIAGVVNFILRDDFQGLEANLSYGITEEDDGETFSASLATGGSFADGNGHAMLMVSYNDRDPIYNAARPFSAISGASGTSPLGSTTFDSTNLPTIGAINTALGSTGAAVTDQFGFNNNGTLFDYVGRRNFSSPGGITYDGFTQPGPFFNPDFSFNTGALNLNVLPQKRYNLFSAVDYDINEHANVYTNVLFTQYDSASELAASPAASTTGFRVPVSNPFIPANLRAVLASRATNPLGSFLLNKRFTSLGARRSEELYDVYQITTGIKGETGFGDWTYDAYASYGRTDRTSIQTGNVSRSAVQQLLNATDGGASLCAGGFNWFGDVPLSAACQAFIGKTAKNLVTVEQSNVEFSAQGGLFDLPAGQVRAAVGVDYREDNYRRVPDGSLTGSITVQPCIATAAFNGTAGSGACAGSASSATSAGGNPPLTGNDIAGFNPSAFLAGAVDVSEYFGEVLIPILKDVPLVQELNVTVGGRVGDYSTVGSVSTYKIDFDWTVIDSIRLRGGYQSAVRAPSIGELFAPVLLGFPSIGTPFNSSGPQKSGDPCDVRSGYRSTSGSNLAAASNAGVAGLCVAQGVSNAAVNTYTYTNQQVSSQSGGNAALTEETAKSYSVGAVWTPNFDNPWLENLTASIDYYHIELEDAVGTVDANIALQQCYNANGTSNPTYSASNPFCQLITRDPLSGNVINVASNNQNLAGAEVSGIDVQANWSMDLGPGTIDASVVGGWLDQWTQESIPNSFIERAGFISNTGPLGSSVGSAQPEWKFLTTVNYRVGAFKVGARWQHIGEMTNLNNKTDTVPAIGYLDLLGSWDLTDNLQLRVNVNNVLGELPPTYSPSVQANTDPSTYDTLGRRYTVGLTARF